MVSPSPTIIQSKQDPDKPRTLKSIKRYKSSKHSTEPLNIFYSPQLRKTFAAVPASAVMPNSNEPPKVIKMKMPTSYSNTLSAAQLQTSNLKSCLKYGSRANSCDIQAMLQDRRSPAPMPIIPQPVHDTVWSSFSFKTKKELWNLGFLFRIHFLHRANDVVPKRMFSIIVRLQSILTRPVHRMI